MNHRYRSAGRPGEPIEVVAVSDGGVPAVFRWRGRRYAVGAVVATWVEAMPWWVDRGYGQRAAERTVQRHVWRVEAAPRTGTSGVYDLYRISHDDASQWGLERVID
jgi:hypothetical protein